MKSFLTAVAIVLVIVGVVLGGGYLWVDHKFPVIAETEPTVVDVVEERTEEVLTSVDKVLTKDPVIVSEPTTVVEVPTEELTTVVVNRNDGIPDYRSPEEIAKLISKTPPTPEVVKPTINIVEEANPPNRMKVLNRWIRRDDEVFLQFETVDLGRGVITLSCVGGNVTIRGSHTGIDVQRMIFDFPGANKVLTLTNQTRTFNRTIGHMIRGNYVGVTYEGLKYKSVPYKITLNDFTASTETLRRTCK